MAWKPADMHALPSGEDKNQALGAIERIKSELAAATTVSEQDLGRLARDLEELQAWVAPIRRIPFEILSEIIIISAKLDWWSPALIASVCRFWRAVAFATPRAWSFINLKSQPPADVASRFFERSGECLIHVTIPFGLEEYGPVVRKAKSRIKCLVLTKSSRNLILIREQYYNLTRLSITYPHTSIPLEYLDATSFPNLRYIDGSFITYGRTEPLRSPHANPPPVERLIVATDDSLAWIAAIRTFSRTLIALQITVFDKAALPAYPAIALPKVAHLAIIPAVIRRIPWHFTAKTPSLTTHHSIEGDDIYSTAIDVASVTHLRSWDSIPLLRYARLRNLHLYGYNADPQPTLSFIEQLSRDYHTCMDLECIITGSWAVLNIHDITQKLAKRNEYTGIDLKIQPAGDSDESWPGDIPVSVRSFVMQTRDQLTDVFSVATTCPVMYNYDHTLFSLLRQAIQSSPPR